jgi:hypothetical protein
MIRGSGRARWPVLGALGALACALAYAHPQHLQLTPAEQGVAPPTGTPPCDPPGPFGWPGLDLPPSEIGAWSPVTPWPVQATHAAVLHTGKVLFWREGEAGIGEATITYLWDPQADTMTSVLTPSSELFCSGHVTLADGRLLAGGGNEGSEIGWGPVDTNVFDPLTETWTRVADMSFGRYYATLTLLPDGRAIAISGSPDPWTSTSPIPEVYDPATDHWEQLPSALNWFNLYPHTFVIPDGRLLFAGPTTNTQALNLETWAWEALPQATYYNIIGSAVQYEPGKIMKCGGGSGPAQFPYDVQTEILDMTAAPPSWTVTSPMHHPRGWIELVILPDGKVLVVGGATGGSGYSGECAVHAPELWDPATRTWSVMASHQRPREYHSSAFLLPDGRVLSASGENLQFGLGGESNYEIYSPPYLFQGDRPEIDWAPGSVGYGGPFTVITPDAPSIAKVALVRPSSVTHSFDENQRYVPLEFTLLASSRLRITAPPGPTWAPPGYYLLFILDANGVPSVGEFVLLGNCTATTSNETACANAADDDCDGLTDIADPQCGQPQLPFAPAGAVPDGASIAGAPLRLERVPGERMKLTWGPSCAEATDYAIYEGTIGDWDSHVPVFCSTNGATERTFGRRGDTYYLVVPRNQVREGSYGLDSAGNERASSSLACRPQEIGTCAREMVP